VSTDVTSIPVVDIRAGGPVCHATEGSARTKELRDDCVAWLPRLVVAALPIIDAMTRRWLRRSRSPYVAEVASIAAALPYPGVWFLNGSYQWGCTACARDEAGMPWLARTLDWPFPGLGRHLEVAHMRGPAGDFYSITWPGYVGVLTATAPGRFAACMNQAPLFRRTRRIWLRPYDFVCNMLGTWRLRHMPPDHLLRAVFETCDTFDQACQRLEETPVARPVIYTLVGCRPGERRVIERTEEGFNTRAHDTAAANDWLHSALPWEARMRTDQIFVRTSEEAAQHSRNRREALEGWPGQFTSGSFAWVTPPVLNPYTRLAVEMCPASATLRVVGYDRRAGHDLPEPVAELREFAAVATS
jgi:hypothetical protein